MTKIAVAVIHGVGNQTPNFADELIDAISARCLPECGEDVVIRSVHWAPVLQEAESTLWERAAQGGTLHLLKVRRFMVNFLGDAFAYQPTPSDRQVYDAIHQVFADTLHALAREAGADAPLCVIAHSLGSVIASNYLYDLQVDQEKRLIAQKVREHISPTPLELGETLALFYTLGSPIGLWSLRYRGFGIPISVPASALARHYPTIEGEWVNFYDADDVVGFPLKTLNEAYRRVVTMDKQVNVGSLLESWNPLSHLAYWTDDDIIEPIAQRLIATWKSVNLFTDKEDEAQKRDANESFRGKLLNLLSKFTRSIRA